MRILNGSSDGRYVSGFETLTAEVYGSHPGYAAHRAASMSRAVDPRKPVLSPRGVHGVPCIRR